jgi:hypothetical protein
MEDKTPRTSEVEATPDAGSSAPQDTPERGKTSGNSEVDAQPDKPVQNEEGSKN